MQPSNTHPDPWHAKPMPQCAPVPPSYHGVWVRTLLETPQLCDTTTLVRWMQLGRWHADLRVPTSARVTHPDVLMPYSAADSTLLKTVQQGFCGITQVTRSEAGEVCTWHRLVDYQPPALTPDAGWMVFENPETVIETGIHGIYREVWQRLPQSTGRMLALAEPARTDGQASARLLLAGDYAMRVRPAAHAAALSQADPSVEISFGLLQANQWHVQHSTWPALEGQHMGLSIQRTSGSEALVHMDNASALWEILEWSEEAGAV
jgi:hypothetical protein